MPAKNRKPSHSNGLLWIGLALLILVCGLVSRSSTPVAQSVPVLATATPGMPTAAPTTAPPTASPTPMQTTMAPTILPSPTPTYTPAPDFATESPVMITIVDDETTPTPTPPPTVPPTAPPTEAPVQMPAEPSAKGLELMTTAPGKDPSYTYASEKVRVEISQYNVKNVVYFAAEIWLTDVSQLRSAFSSDKFDGATEPVRDIAERNGAILAINGDFATFNNGGIIIRNGEVFRTNRSTRQLLVIDKNGDFIPYVDPPENAEEAAAAFLEEGVWQTLVFGPVLVDNGQAIPLPQKFFINTRGALEPRTAVAQLGPLHYLFLIVDGRQDNYSKGVSLERLQELLIEHGAITAFNLDGGGSTTLVFNNNVINQPANGGQRHVPDIIYIGE